MGSTKRPIKLSNWGFVLLVLFSVCTERAHTAGLAEMCLRLAAEQSGLPALLVRSSSTAPPRSGAGSAPSAAEPTHPSASEQGRVPRDVWADSRFAQENVRKAHVANLAGLSKQIKGLEEAAKTNAAARATRDKLIKTYNDALKELEEVTVALGRDSQLASRITESEKRSSALREQVTQAQIGVDNQREGHRKERDAEIKVTRATPGEEAKNTAAALDRVQKAEAELLKVEKKILELAETDPTESLGSLKDWLAIPINRGKTRGDYEKARRAAFDANLKELDRNFESYDRLIKNLDKVTKDPHLSGSREGGRQLALAANRANREGIARDYFENQKHLGSMRNAQTYKNHKDLSQMDVTYTDENGVHNVKLLDITDRFTRDGLGEYYSEGRKSKWMYGDNDLSWNFRINVPEWVLAKLLASGQITQEQYNSVKVVRKYDESGVPTGEWNFIAGTAGYFRNTRAGQAGGSVGDSRAATPRFPGIGDNKGTHWDHTDPQGRILNAGVIGPMGQPTADRIMEVRYGRENYGMQGSGGGMQLSDGGMTNKVPKAGEWPGHVIAGAQAPAVEHPVIRYVPAVQTAQGSALDPSSPAGLLLGTAREIGDARTLLRGAGVNFPRYKYDWPTNRFIVDDKQNDIAMAPAREARIGGKEPVSGAELKKKVHTQVEAAIQALENKLKNPLLQQGGELGVTIRGDIKELQRQLDELKAGLKVLESNP